MNRIERIKMVKAMEYIARQVNDEDVFASWLVYGVADEDIGYGDLEVGKDDLEGRWIGIGDYIEDENFADLMHLFLKVMSDARESGGLYCDGVVDKPITD